MVGFLVTGTASTGLGRPPVPSVLGSLHGPAITGQGHPLCPGSSAACQGVRSPACPGSAACCRLGSPSVLGSCGLPQSEVPPLSRVQAWACQGGGPRPVPGLVACRGLRSPSVPGPAQPAEE